MWLSKLRVKYIKGSKNPKQFFLKEPLIWDDIKVPMCFDTDFASVPKYLRCIYPSRGKYSKAAVIHDFMYSVNWYSKELADTTFLNIMLHDGVSKKTAYLFYYSVKFFGGSSYGTK